MRERLFELIVAEIPDDIPVDCLPDVDAIVDHLLAAGVIVPPYKPLPLVDEGDRVLCPECETDLMGCYYSGYDNAPTVVTCYGCGAWIDATKAVSKEEAEKALAERREG